MVLPNSAYYQVSYCLHLAPSVADRETYINSKRYTTKLLTVRPLYLSDEVGGNRPVFQVIVRRVLEASVDSRSRLVSAPAHD